MGFLKISILSCLITVYSAALLVSCKNDVASVVGPKYRISCNPTMQMTADGTKLTPNIDWEQLQADSFTYQAKTYFRVSDSAAFQESFLISGGGSESKDSSNRIVKRDDIKEVIVLVEVFDKDKNVVERIWFTS